MKARGVITLPMELADDNNKAIRSIEFLIVDTWSPYNAMLGRYLMHIWDGCVATTLEGQVPHHHGNRDLLRRLRHLKKVIHGSPNLMTLI